MKKILFAALVIFGLGTAQAGPTALEKIRFGMRVTPGLSYAKISKTGMERDGFNYSFGYGLDVEYKMTEYFSFLTGGLMNSFRGNVSYTNDVYLTYDVSDNGVTSADTAATLLSRKYTFKSVDIPLKLKFHTTEIGYITYFMEFGMTLNVIYDAFSKKNQVKLNEGDETITTLSDDLSKLDERDDAAWMRAALNIGGGIEYNLAGPTNLLIGVNWNNSFTNVLNKTSKSVFYKSTDAGLSQIVKNDYVALSIGIQF